MGAPKWLVTGGGGQLGGALAQLAVRQRIDVWAPDRLQCDLASENSIIAAVKSQRWDAVLNCAAYTAVDKAESEPEQAEMINTTAPAILARETELLGIPLIHVSTDYVFDGCKTTPYLEADPVNPLGVYGRTKEAGEVAVREGNPLHAIVRTAWLVSAGSTNFLDTMLRLAQERSAVSVVNDQLGCPSNAEDVAFALFSVARELGGRSGTWHFVNDGQASWYQLAAHIFSATRMRGLPTPALVPITSGDYPTRVRRPSNSRLVTDKIVADFGVVPRHWQTAIDDILAKRLNR